MGNASEANSGNVGYRTDYAFFFLFLMFFSSFSSIAQCKTKSWDDSKAEFYLQQKSDSIFPYLERMFKKASIDKNHDQMFEIYRWQLVAIDKLNRLNYMQEVIQQADSLVIKQATSDQIVELERLKGRIFWRMRYFDKARTSFFILLNHSQKSFDSTTISVAFNNLGLLYSEQAMFDSAMYMFQKAIEISTKRRNVEEIASTLNLIGNTYLRFNKYYDAKEYYSQALLSARNSKNSEIQAKILLNLSKVSHKAGKNLEALQFIDSATNIWLQTKNNSQLAAMLIEKGAIYRNLNQYGTALENYRKALEIRKRLGDKLQIAATYVNIGTIYKDINMSEMAINFYSQALDIYKELKNDQYIATTLNYIGGVHYKNGNFDRALDYYLSSFRYFEVINDKFEQANLYINIALMYKNLGNIEQSLIHYQKALEIFQSIDDQKRIADVLGYIGNLYLASNRLQLAEAHFVKSLQIRQQINDQNGLIYSKYDLSTLEIGRGNFFRAEKHLKTLWQNYAKLPNLEFKMNVANNLAFVYEQQQHFDLALSYHKKRDSIKDSLVNIKLIEQASELKYRTEVENIRIGDLDSQTSESNKRIQTGDHFFERKLQGWEWLEHFAVAFGVLLLIISVLFLTVLHRSRPFKQIRKDSAEGEILHNTTNQGMKGLSTGEIAQTLLEIYKQLIFDLLRETQINLEKNADSDVNQQCHVCNNTLKILANNYDILDMQIGEQVSKNHLENQIFNLKNLVDELKEGYFLFSISRQINIQNMVDENTIILGNPIYYKFLLILLFDFFVNSTHNNAAIYITHHKEDKYNRIAVACDKVYFTQPAVKQIQQFFQGENLPNEILKAPMRMLLTLIQHGMVHIEILKYAEIGTQINISTLDLFAATSTGKQKTV